MIPQYTAPLYKKNFNTQINVKRITHEKNIESKHKNSVSRGSRCAKYKLCKKKDRIPSTYFLLGRQYHIIEGC